MFTIELAPYGLKLKSWGFHTPEIGREWFKLYVERLEEVKRLGRPFGQYVDLRGFKPAAPEAQQLIVKGMQMFKEAGGMRSIGVLDNAVAVMQIRRLAKESGIYEWQRYLDPETYPDFEARAIAWIEYGEDPDVRLAG